MVALKATNGKSLGGDTTTVSKQTAKEYEVSVNGYGQSMVNVNVVNLSCETDAGVDDIKSIEFYTPTSYKGKYVLQAGEKLMDEWLLHADYVNTIDEDVTVVLKVTFKNGKIAYDHAIFKIRNEEIYFGDTSLSIEENYGVTKDEHGVYHTEEGNPYGGIGSFDLGILSTWVARISNSIEFTSSDENVFTVKSAGAHQQPTKGPRKFYVTFGSAGMAVLTAKATDDSGVEVTEQVTIVVEPAQEGA